MCHFNSTRARAGAELLELLYKRLNTRENSRSGEVRTTLERGTSFQVPGQVPVLLEPSNYLILQCVLRLCCLGFNPLHTDLGINAVVAFADSVDTDCAPDKPGETGPGDDFIGNILELELGWELLIVTHLPRSECT